MDKENDVTKVDKKIWIAPKVNVYGTVEEITGTGTFKPKKWGTGDDFFTSITSSISSY